MAISYSSFASICLYKKQDRCQQVKKVETLPTQRSALLSCTTFRGRLMHMLLLPLDGLQTPIEAQYAPNVCRFRIAGRGRTAFLMYCWSWSFAGTSIQSSVGTAHFFQIRTPMATSSRKHDETSAQDRLRARTEVREFIHPAIYK
jgi:hypothetical protein